MHSTFCHARDLFSFPFSLFPPSFLFLGEGGGRKILDTDTRKLPHVWNLSELPHPVVFLQVIISIRQKRLGIVLTQDRMLSCVWQAHKKGLLTSRPGGLFACLCSVGTAAHLAQVAVGTIDKKTTHKNSEQEHIRQI